MKYIEEINNYNWQDIHSRIYAKKARDVEQALDKEKLGIDDFMALISPAAIQYLEPMAVRSRKYTQQRFGKTIQLYIPLYLTNSCMNHCVYCGFNHANDIRRIILTDEQILREVEAIKKIGDFQHILLVTGENPRDAGVDYIQNAIRLVKPYFSSISIEVQPLKEEEYKQLEQEGLHAVYCYQETYHKERYKTYHPKGMKSKFDWRLDSFDRMGRAGIHKMGLGVLIGLEDWRTDSTLMALHLRYLQKHYWQTKYSISFPRMRPHEGNSFQPNVVMSDKELAQILFAYRLFDHDIEIALSTREDQVFRDHMTTLGVTSLSAGSKTDPGGYAVYQKELEQFTINDDRSPAEVLKAVKEQGYEVIWKDWDFFNTSNSSETT
ncbi:2-iminoacetate synthase ThiH [Parabacteroides sp. 52]|uniref:2-iminoacetate synthase ThiH n=1 Tax=unclassified Parabacteroides TaxID=2649774 RepID=UPI0013CF7DF7|nr:MULTISPECIES: 2-iminoacetate synthase ThiH [unclassified Parabacteroides]MDH6533871.1 2-iminoacetate synthase [Parabacteroides sp. PM5-20]NDV54616.1 2-iminoacetate synthase ThiH [Parabacteroides sp. 52]